MSAAGGDVRLAGDAAARARRATRENELLVGVGAGLLAVALAATALQGLSFTPQALPAIVMLAVVGPWLLSRPHWVIPLFVAATWTSFGRGTFGGLPTPVELGGPLLFGVAAWYALPRLRVARDVAVVCALVCAPVLTAGLLSPVDPRIDISFVRNITFLVIVALGLRSAADVERAGIALCWTGILLSIGGVLSVTAGPVGPFLITDEGNPDLGISAPRAAGAFGDPNFFALSLAAIIPFALHLTSLPEWRHRLLGAASLVALMAGIFSSGSRGGLLAAGVGVIVFGLASPIRGARLATVATVLLGVLLVPLFGSVLGTSANREVGGRATENFVAVHMFLDHPLTGVGVGEYPTLYRDYTRYIGDDPRVLRLPHSLPLEIAAEQGVVGILGWAAALFILLRLVIAKQLWRSSIGRATVLALVVYLVGSLFLHGGQPRLLFMLMGLVLALAASPPRPAQVVRAG